METVKTEQDKMSHKNDEPIHFFVNAVTPGDPRVALRWCICPDVFNELKEKEVLSPHLLISIWVRDKYHTWKETGRKFVPLGQTMEYIYFQGAGLHRILGTIVWPCESMDGMKKHFLKQSREGVYENTLLGGPRFDPQHDYGISFDNSYGWIKRGTTLKIDVAEEYFAKEPPEWLRSWVNLFFETKPRDQCHFRRRCILAFTLQPILVLLWIFATSLIKIVAVVFFLLLGMRDIGFEALKHPFDDMPNDVWENCSSVVLRDKDGKMRPFPLLLVLLPLTPVFPFLILVLAGIIMMCHGTINYLFLFGITVAATFSSSMLLLFFLGLGKGIGKTFGSINEVIKDEKIAARREKKEKKEKEKELVLVRMYDEKISTLVCTGVPLRAELDALPPGRKTLYLRFMNLKTKVCKPFARY